MVDALYSRGCLEARLYFVLSFFSPPLPTFPIVSQAQRVAGTMSELSSEGTEIYAIDC